MVFWRSVSVWYRWMFGYWQSIGGYWRVYTLSVAIYELYRNARGFFKIKDSVARVW